MPNGYNIKTTTLRQITAKDKLRQAETSFYIQKQPLEVFYKKVWLKNLQYILENTYAGVSFLLKTPVQVFFCESCGIFRNTIFTENVLATGPW